MPSFDIISEANKVELKNAIEQANKEITNRFDFKGSDSRIEQKELELTLYADDDFKLGQVKDVMLNKMWMCAYLTKRPAKKLAVIRSSKSSTSRMASKLS